MSAGEHAGAGECASAGERAADGEGAWDELRPPAAGLIEDCVHCGFCLPTCPSYAVFEDEMDSPRGRIVLMDLGREPGSAISTEMLTHFDRCLGCMACVTACPSGVRYDRLLEQTRPQLERGGPRSRAERAYRQAIFAFVTHPGRMRAAVPALALERSTGIGRVLAKRTRHPRLRALLTLSPRVGLGAMTRRLAPLTRSRAPRKHGRVVFLQGCVQRVCFGEVNEATVRVLSAEGWEVHAPRAPRCCGALQLHSGFEPQALERARETIAACEDFDRVVVNAAGCGSAMKEYGELLADDPAWAARARSFSERVRDVHELLTEEEPQAVRKELALRVAYHDACHLAHAQGIRSEPRELLRAIPGLELLEPAEWELCCGSAGIYNLTQPEAAAELGRRKAQNLLATGARAIAAANPGCALQIAAYLPPGSMPVHHPMTILDHSLRGATL